MKETIYRVIQEGMSNAIRHGAPTRVQIAIAHDGDDGIRVEVADDGIGMPADGNSHVEPTQFGLMGMRERVMAMAGSLSIQPGHDGKGLALVVRLPCVVSRNAAIRTRWNEGPAGRRPRDRPFRTAQSADIGGGHADFGGGEWP